MRRAGRIEKNQYTEIDYHQFSMPGHVRVLMALLGVLTWPVTVPLALLSRLSDFIFLFCSQMLALVPYVIGTIVRYEFYRFSLSKCGKNVMIGFGTVFVYRDIEIGDHVLIGMYNTIHYCNFGSYVLTADGCRFLSGSKYHNYTRTDVPMALPRQMNHVRGHDSGASGLSRRSLIGRAVSTTEPVIGERSPSVSEKRPRLSSS